jgi:hypothetical protein
MEKKHVKFDLKNKILATFVIILMTASAIAAVTPVKAATYTNMQSGASVALPSGVTPDNTISTTAYLSCSPNPIGVNQQLLVNVWMEPPLFVGRWFTGYTVTITKPDGTTVTEGPMDSYPGDTTAWFQYTPDQVGTYTLKFTFPGGYYPVGNYSVSSGTFVGAGVTSITQSTYYQPSVSQVTTLTVQNTTIASWPPAALPTDYWTRPVSPSNREWASILGWSPSTGIVGGGTSWPADTNKYMSNYNFIPYVQAPNTAHVVWRRQGDIAGIIGGSVGDQSLQGGGGNPLIVYAGRAYQTLTKVYNGVPQMVWQCWDLRTGQIYWEQPVPTYQTQTTFGPTVSPPASAPNIVLPISITSGSSTGEAGAANAAPSLAMYLLFVGSGRWITFNAMTGAVTQNVSISPLTSGTCYGNNLFYSVQNIGTTSAPNYRLINWTVTGPVGAGSAGYAVNYALTVLSNTTWPWSSFPSTVDYESGVAVTVTSITNTGTQVGGTTNITAASLVTGQVLWSKVVNEEMYSGSCSVADHGKIAILFLGGHYEAFNLQTGALAWTSPNMDYPWGQSSFGAYAVQSAYGLIYRESYDGIYAFNWADGTIAWHYVPVATPFETPYNDQGNISSYSCNSGGIVADGKLYTLTTEHTPSQPITRGWGLYCINATSGQGIWNINGVSMSPGQVSDGYLTASASDGYTYVFGKGQSETTVSAPQTQVTTGTSAVISGTVLDESPANPGIACVSDASMSQWMDYQYMQASVPTNVTGIPVSIDAVDPNGNYVHIGDITSDMSGTFAYTWTPTIPGDYKITATFAGSNSYGSSYAETHTIVVNAPAASVTPVSTVQAETTTNSDLMTALIVGIVVIVIAIAAVGVLLLRKH